ncbi:class I SAM-dependent methyltransferase [Robertkochia sediminum]|uniref:class I SAM-dependent methyltransferase n=1 Tax=Robertkochia sediminum TaxID=2785326 RepID=UPI0019323FD7|nr:class I SAM-dependent methyltransferase [Robertkochia sediminum]MBL7472240.1 methyltransferase domain-containing protein [Robertkochia sediminum]
MTEFEYIIDLHRNSERQGPGSEADTLKALSFVTPPKDRPMVIADIGCGSGGQTLTLAKHTDGIIKAVDLFPEFLEELDEKVKAEGLENRIKTVQASMTTMPFAKEEFDLIWSEGAIYNIGFEKGIRQWHKLLKPGGFLAVSEITWITENRPKAIDDFWNTEYPEISRASKKIKQLEDNGYTLAGYFYLPPESWNDSYYAPMEARFDDYLERNDHAEAAREVVDENRREIALYNEFKDFYSYGFYIARKDG